MGHTGASGKSPNDAPGGHRDTGREGQFFNQSWWLFCHGDKTNCPQKKIFIHVIFIHVIFIHVIFSAGFSQPDGWVLISTDFQLRPWCTVSLGNLLDYTARV